MNKAVVGIDVGATNTAFGIVDINGNIIQQDFVSTNAFTTAEEFVFELSNRINFLINKRCRDYEIKAIGIGAPNGNYYRGTIEHAANLKWSGIIHLAEMFRKQMNMPTYLTNDANAAALGEMVFGAGRGMKDFIEITLGTGLGSGFVVNGKLMYGHDGFAGELGHVTYDYQGRACGCGRKGCLETYVSATGIKRTLLELMANSNINSPLRDLSPNELSAKDIHYYAEIGDALALETYEITGKILGTMLASIVAITSPQAIFLFGGLAKSGDLLIKPTKRNMEKHLLEVFKNKVNIELSALMHENAAVLGAAALAFSEMDSDSYIYHHTPISDPL